MSLVLGAPHLARTLQGIANRLPSGGSPIGLIRPQADGCLVGKMRLADSAIRGVAEQATKPPTVVALLGTPDPLSTPLQHDRSALATLHCPNASGFFDCS